MFNRLKEKYPKLITDNTDISCGEGWENLIDNFLSTMDRYNKKFMVAQIKNKLGSMRIHISPIDGKYPVEMDKNSFDPYPLIHFAENMSETICEKCGNKGKQKNIKGWLTVSCVNCDMLR